MVLTLICGRIRRILEYISVRFLSCCSLSETRAQWHLLSFCAWFRFHGEPVCSEFVSTIQKNSKLSLGKKVVVEDKKIECFAAVLQCHCVEFHFLFWFSNCTLVSVQKCCFCGIFPISVFELT